MKPNSTKTALVTALAVLATCPVGARAAEKAKDAPPVYDNSVEAGIGYSSESSAKFGEWSGIGDQGAYAIGSFRLDHRPRWDGDSREHWLVTGDNLGLDSRALSATYGRQGSYKLQLNYDEIPHLRFNDAQTPFLGVGTSNLTLPANWVGATSTTGMTQLNPSLQPFDIETERKRITATLHWIPADGWDTSAKFRHETKEGVDAMFVAFGTNGGNPSAMQIPELIDYETNEVELSVGYGDRRAQASLGYQLSMFDNGNAGTMFQNPFSARFSGGAWAAGSGYPTGRGQVAGAPDNMAHSLTLSGGYNVTDTTRLTANVTYIHMTQDERFLPYSANPLLAATSALPRTSLDGEVDRLVIDVGGSARPVRGLDLRASYRFQNFDNSTPQDTYIRIAGDAENQPAAPAALATDGARINVPYSFRQHKVKLDGSYRVTPRAKVALGYEFDQHERDDVDVETTREHTASIKLSGRPADSVNGWIRYARAWRDGSFYMGNAGFLAGHTAAYLATLAPGTAFENDPRLQRFWLADRDRNILKGRLNFQVSDEVTLGFDGGFTKDSYESAPLGVQDSRHINATADLSWMPRESLRMSAFVTYDNFRQGQLGCSRGGGNQQCITDPLGTGLTRTWEVDVEDNVYTTGLRADWAAIKNKLDIGVDFSFSRAITFYEFQQGTALAGPTDAFPRDIRSRLFGLGLNADYHVRDNLSVRLAYRYQQMSTRDWAVDGIAPDTIGRVLSLGTTSPDYTAHLFGVAAKYEF